VVTATEALGDVSSGGSAQVSLTTALLEQVAPGPQPTQGRCFLEEVKVMEN